MRNIFKQLPKFPIIILFFGFLVVFVIADMVTPDKEVSAMENRKLTQYPTFSLTGITKDFASFAENYDALADEWSDWTYAYGDYAKDQMLFRDEWISLQSFFESVQGKLENGGIWFAKDDYLIAKNDIFTQLQENNISINSQAVCELAERHKGKVSTMIIPSPANSLSDKLRWNPPQINENEMLDNLFADFKDAGANVIDLRGAFEAYVDDDIFYHTDHHWTTLGGAYLAYEAYCEAEGLIAEEPSQELLREEPDFLGTNYSKSKHFGTKPETLYYYDFPNELTVYSYQSDDTILEETGPLMDIYKFDEYDKYAAFLHGNKGYSVLKGNGKGSILVVKDSYGNSFVPYLIANYETIGIIDLRAWFSVDETIKEGGYDNILVLYSFDSFSSDTYAKRMLTDMQ